MALSQNKTLSSGLQLTSAYIKIVNLNGSKDGMYITAGIYVSHDASLQNKDAVEQVDYYFTPSVTSIDNTFKQAYDYLKTLPDFTGAIDVLEGGQTA